MHRFIIASAPTHKTMKKHAATLSQNSTIIMSRGHIRHHQTLIITHTMHTKYIIHEINKVTYTNRMNYNYLNIKCVQQNKTTIFKLGLAFSDSCENVVNSCDISRGMGVTKVSDSKSEFQGHSRSLRGCVILSATYNFLLVFHCNPSTRIF